MILKRINIIFVFNRFVLKDFTFVRWLYIIPPFAGFSLLCAATNVCWSQGSCRPLPALVWLSKRSDMRRSPMPLLDVNVWPSPSRSGGKVMMCGESPMLPSGRDGIAGPTDLRCHVSRGLVVFPVCLWGWWVCTFVHWAFYELALTTSWHYTVFFCQTTPLVLSCLLNHIPQLLHCKTSEGANATLSIIGTKGNSESAWRLTAFGTNTTHMESFHIKNIFLLPNWLDVQFRQQRTL